MMKIKVCRNFFPIMEDLTEVETNNQANSNYENIDRITGSTAFIEETNLESE